MAEIGRWNGHKFIVSAQKIESFADLTIKSSSETEEKTASQQKYVSRKNGKPREISLTVQLRTGLGVDVRKEAEAFADEARAGAKDYFYINNKKLDTYKLMLTDANISQIELSSGGKWVSADVALTLKQAETKTDPPPKKTTPKGKDTTPDQRTQAKAAAAAAKAADKALNDIKQKMVKVVINTAKAVTLKKKTTKAGVKQAGAPKR